MGEGGTDGPNGEDAAQSRMLGQAEPVASMRRKETFPLLAQERDWGERGL